MKINCIWKWYSLVGLMTKTIIHSVSVPSAQLLGRIFPLFTSTALWGIIVKYHSCFHFFWEFCAMCKLFGKQSIRSVYIRYISNYVLDNLLLSIDSAEARRNTWFASTLAFSHPETLESVITGAYAGRGGVHMNPPPGKKFRSEMSKRGVKVPPRYVGKKECARSAQIRQN